jgi:hypothetical protein
MTVSDRLKELAEVDEALHAPDRVEAKLLAAFRPRGRSNWWVFAAVAAAVVLTAGVAWTLRPAPALELALTRPAPPAAPPVAVQKAAVVRPPRRAPRPAPVEREVVTEFIPMTPGESFSEDEPARLVRVRMPRAALASFGLQVYEGWNSEKVQADVLLGQDGTPRAIRLVNAAVFR